MASKLKVPILLEWNDIQSYMEQHDIVEVVRCKNCKYSEPYDGSTKATLRLKCLYRSGVLENWFCEHGERR